MVRWISRFAFVVFFLFLNYRLTVGHHEKDVVSQLRFLRSALEADEDQRMQMYFPEGFLFTNFLYGLSWVEVGLQDSGQREEALANARWAMARLKSPQGVAPFLGNLKPEHGVFYSGWVNVLQCGILKLQPEGERNEMEVQEFVTNSKKIADAFSSSETPFLMAYPNKAWPVDSVVAIASLCMHDSLLPNRFQPIVDRWKAEAKTLLDPNTGLMPHRVDAVSGKLVEPSRGSSQSLITRFLIEIDPEWGVDQYGQFRKQFATTVLGIPGIREYPVGQTGTGDVDSGPLFMGVSLSASTVAVGSARMYGDNELADAMLDVGEAFAFPFVSGDAKRYAFGQLPVADAFLAWSKSSTPWTRQVFLGEYPAVQPSWWRITVYLPSVLLAWLAYCFLWRPHQPKNSYARPSK